MHNSLEDYRFMEMESYSVRSCVMFSKALAGTFPLNEFLAILNTCSVCILPNISNGKSPENWFPLKSLFNIQEQNRCTVYISGP